MGPEKWKRSIKRAWRQNIAECVKMYSTRCNMDKGHRNKMLPQRKRAVGEG